MRDLPIGARLYVAAVIVTGAVIVLIDVLRLEQWGYALALMFLVLVATRLTTPLRRAVVSVRIWMPRLCIGC